MIERCVRTNYSFMTAEEQAEVIKEAKLCAQSEDIQGVPSYSERKRKIYENVLNYLDENTSIVPCGFVDFRFKDAYFWAESLCSLGADIYFDRREYEEFTYLLSMFVASRECKEEVIHVIWENDKIKLINKRGRDVTKKYQKEFLSNSKYSELNEDDLAISSIISASPEKIVLHSPPKTPLTNALKKIFSDKCRVCEGCNVCKRY